MELSSEVENPRKQFECIDRKRSRTRFAFTRQKRSFNLIMNIFVENNSILNLIMAVFVENTEPDGRKENKSKAKMRGHRGVRTGGPGAAVVTGPVAPATCEDMTKTTTTTTTMIMTRDDEL